MWDDVGIVRDAASLQRATGVLDELDARLDGIGVEAGNLAFNLTWHDWLNLKSQILVSKSICFAAVAREDSRGAHYRSDFPDVRDLENSRYTCVTWGDGRFHVATKPVVFSRVKPGETLLVERLPPERRVSSHGADSNARIEWIMMAIAVREESTFVLALCLLAAAGVRRRRTIPASAIRMLVPFPAGGGSDTIARVTAQKLSQRARAAGGRRQPRGRVRQHRRGNGRQGGAGRLYADVRQFVDRHQPGGLPASSPFDPVKDLVPISMVSSYPFVLVVHPSLPVKSVKELVALAKAKPGALTYSSAGAGTMSHLAMELLSLQDGHQAHASAVQGRGAGVDRLLSGEAQLAFIVMPVAQVQINAGQAARARASPPRARSAVVPQVPTMQEAGVADNEALQWNGLFAPAKTPQAILDRLHREVVKALAHRGGQAAVRSRRRGPGGQYAGGVRGVLPRGSGEMGRRREALRHEAGLEPRRREITRNGEMVFTISVSS